MRGLKASFLLVAVISLLSLSQPAQAQQIVHDPTSLAKLIADAGSNLLKMLSGIGNLLGSTGSTMPGTLGMIDGKPILEEPCPYVSLVNFLDKCQKQQRRQEIAYAETVKAQAQAADIVDRKRTADAAMQIQHKQKINELEVQAYNDALGRDATFCDRPSLERATLAQIFIARMILEERMNKLSQRMAGDSSDPIYARGELGFYQGLIEKRKAEGLISCTGNDGANDQLCGGGSGSADIVNADQRATTLSGSWLLSSQEKKPFSEKYAEYYIDNLMGPGPMPVKKDQLDKLTPQAAEVLANQARYASLMSEFGKPFNDAFAERMGTEGLSSLESLGAVLDRANIKGQERARLIENNKTSKKGAEFIRYKVYNHDPRGTTSLVDKSVLNQGNLIAMVLQKEMDQVTLLYDLNETLEETNRLLGALGIQGARQYMAQITSQARQLRNGSGGK